MKDEIKFLKELQEELKTQDTDCQAAPRFWVVGDYEMVATMEGCEDYYMFYSTSHEHHGSSEIFINHLIENYDKDNDNYTLGELKGLKDLDDEELLEWLIENYDCETFMVPMVKKHVTKQDTLFLTKAEAKEHIKLNHYHYTKEAHTYAMTAWRAPKVEKLLKILETFDWDSVSS